MIGEILLVVTAGGAAAFVYFVAPAARGAHRLVVPRYVLRARIVELEREADSMVCAVARSLTDVQSARRDRDEAQAALGKAELLTAGLEEQLATLVELRAENTALRAALGNAWAMRQLSAAPLPPDDASALPDNVQEFVDQTAAWRARV